MFKISKKTLLLITPPIIVFECLYIENMNILKLLLEKDPNLTIKNNKGQTAIDVTKSKSVINLFWKYLTKGSDKDKVLEDVSENIQRTSRSKQNPYVPVGKLKKKCTQEAKSPQISQCSERSSVNSHNHYRIR